MSCVCVCSHSKSIAPANRSHTCYGITGVVVKQALWSPPLTLVKVDAVIEK